MRDTNRQYLDQLDDCRKMFVAKMKDYGPSWRILRPESITDQIFIKAKRIRTLQITGVAAVNEGIRPELVGIVNYAVMGIIQLSLPLTESKDISAAQALELYDTVTTQAFELMKAKNHDYGEAWRDMRMSSYVDLILAKILRTKEIEDNRGAVKVSEGIDANYFDMINYAIFGLIKLSEQC
ncbi:MAG: DUF1599 domain-containing protein [Muribaculaceae bacterium]|nr:DUF1599 domain-containing protein [Muribaculaceae bacterium]